MNPDLTAARKSIGIAGVYLPLTVRAALERRIARRIKRERERAAAIPRGWHWKKGGYNAMAWAILNRKSES